MARRVVTLDDITYHVLLALAEYNRNPYDVDAQHTTLAELFALFSKWYYEIWNEIMNEAEMRHTPHECRHTFRSALDSADGNKRCIDLIMGHKSKDVGERIYTHKTLTELKATVELITY